MVSQKNFYYLIDLGENYVIFKNIEIIPRRSVPTGSKIQIYNLILESQISKTFNNQFIVVYYCENCLNKKNLVLCQFTHRK